MINLTLAHVAVAVGLQMASSIDWRPLSVTTSGAIWSLARNSAGTGMLGTQPARVALVRLERADGAETIYRAHVPTAHCGKPRGDLVLVSTAGEVLADTFDTARPATTATVLAAAVCQERS